MQKNGFVDLNIDQIMEWLYANQVTTGGYVAIVSDSRIAETWQALQGQKAFRQVLDNPSAVKALECWPMKPPLELAAGAVKFEQSQEVSMVIVAGTLEVDADQREAFLASRIDGMRASRAEPGCLEYTLSADPTDPRRVMLFERWARQEDLDNHLAASRARPASPGTAVAPKATSILVYNVTGERPLGR